MRKVACYVRVSTESQLENYSIGEQIDRLEAYCKARDFVIYKIYTDGGYSGGNMNRPALQLMLEDIPKNLFDTVIVYKLDRLSRSQKDTLTLIEDYFIAGNINFISLCENFDTSSPFGRAMIGILSVFAQLEKDQITERFTMGRIGRSKQGLFHGGGNAPKGYRYIDGKLVVNEYEAAQIQEIFDLFLSGKSINAIQKHMSEKYQNNLWQNAGKISNVIKNPLYIGKVRFKGEMYDGQHTPIISEDVFNQANSLLKSEDREKNKTTSQKTPFRAGYILSSLVYCGKCGARYSANHGYYKCYSRAKSTKKYIADPDCKNKNWLIEDLDSIVCSEVLKLRQDGAIEKLFSQKSSSYEKKSYKQEIAKIDKQIARLVELYQLSDIPIDVLKSKLDDLKNQKDVLENKALEQDDMQKIQQFAENVNTFQSILDSGETEKIRMTLSVLIEKVIVDDDMISIKWRI